MLRLYRIFYLCLCLTLCLSACGDASSSKPDGSQQWRLKSIVDDVYIEDFSPSTQEAETLYFYDESNELAEIHLLSQAVGHGGFAADGSMAGQTDKDVIVRALLENHSADAWTMARYQKNNDVQLLLPNGEPVVEYDEWRFDGRVHYSDWGDTQVFDFLEGLDGLDGLAFGISKHSRTSLRESVLVAPSINKRIENHKDSSVMLEKYFEGNLLEYSKLIFDRNGLIKQKIFKSNSHILARWVNEEYSNSYSLGSISDGNPKKGKPENAFEIFEDGVLPEYLYQYTPVSSSEIHLTVSAISYLHFEPVSAYATYERAPCGPMLAERSKKQIPESFPVCIER